MVKKLITASFCLALLASCSTVRPVSVVASRPAANASASAGSPARQVKFLDDITVDGQSVAAPAKPVASPKTTADKKGMSDIELYMSRSSSNVEKANSLQLKYAVLLNIEVEQLEDTRFLSYVDEWYGTRYRMGGTTKSGIDCSAFVQNVYQAAFAMNVPRTAREQYRASRIISATELKEGDLVFFNTTGGISHVGMYLRNNKFIHASSSQGVTVSDMFDPYYLKRYIGAGRIERPEIAAN